MLKQVCHQSFGCFGADARHDTDELKELHGSPEQPILISELRKDRYVAEEYEKIGRIVVPFQRCHQALYEDAQAVPRRSVDRIVVRDSAGRHHAFYFDISPAMNQEREKIESAYKDYLAGKPIDPKMKRDFERALSLKLRKSF